MALLAVIAMWGEAYVCAQPFDQILQPDLEFAASFLKPDGNLAGGVEVLEQNFIAAVDEANFDSRFLNGELRSAMQSIGTDVESTLQMEIQDVQKELAQANERLQQAKGLREEGRDPCDVYPGCESCTYDLDCVWCDTTQTCQRGNEGGPFASFCLRYDYSYCSLAGCERHSSCTSCLAAVGCGWCAESRSCKAGSQYNSGDCEPTLWLSGPRAICPASSSVGSPTPVDAAKAKQYAKAVSEEEILELQNHIIALNGQLEELTDRKAELKEELPTVVGKGPDVSSVYPQVFYLGDVVDATAQTSEDELLQSVRSEGMKTGKAIGTNTGNAVSNSNNERVLAEDTALKPLEDELLNASKSNSQLYEQLLGVIAANEELLRSINGEEEGEEVTEPVDVPSDTQTKSSSAS